MTPDTTPPSPIAPITGLLALALLVWGSWTAATYVRMAPGTPMPAQVQITKHDKITGAPIPSEKPFSSPTNRGGPGWGELTTPQKEALYPLANNWAQLGESQKRLWLNLAAGFHALSEAEQAKMLARLTDWAGLSTQQRSQARLNFAATSALSGDNKRAQWEAYQALSEEERMGLAAKAAAAVKPLGAAAALHPVPAKKLAHVPAVTATTTTLPNPPKIPPVVDYHAPQALPVSPPPAPPLVETTPIQGATAVPEPLPPLQPASATASDAKSADSGTDLRGDFTPIHPPQ